MMYRVLIEHMFYIDTDSKEDARRKAMIELAKTDLDDFTVWELTDEEAAQIKLLRHEEDTVDLPNELSADEERFLFLETKHRIGKAVFQYEKETGKQITAIILKREKGRMGPLVDLLFEALI